MWQDEIVAEVRERREDYARRLNYDLDAIFQDLKAHEQESGREIVSLPPKRPARIALARKAEESVAR